MTLNPNAAVTEADIADFLARTPGFFERHAELLATIQLTSPHGNRAVSLQERQMQMLRERIKGLERKIMEMIRHGQDNVAIADRLNRWTRAVLAVTDDAQLPATLVAELRHQFLIPQATLRAWRVDARHAALPFAREVSQDVKDFADSLALPYCGANAGFEATSWFDQPAAVQSMAMIALRAPASRGDAHAGTGTAVREGIDAPSEGAGIPASDDDAASGPAFGLLVLGSPDPARYSADMGTEFLSRLGEIASAAMLRLRPRAAAREH